MAGYARGGGTVQVEGLKEFRAALKAAEKNAPRELSKALKKAGVPVAARASTLAPRLSGLLAGGYKITTQGPAASLVNRAPYAAGAEWGFRGKWKGFLKYGAPGRFGWRAIQELADKIAADLYAGLREILTAYGWFHEGGA